SNQWSGDADAPSTDRLLNTDHRLLNTASPRVVVTRSREQAGEFADRLAAADFTPVIFPVIEFAALPPEPLDAALNNLSQYDWLIFTSINAVAFFFQRAEERGVQVEGVAVAAVGSATAVQLNERGLPADFMPDEFTGEQLALGLGDLTGKRVLLPRAKLGRPKIVELLRQQGAEVDDVALYDTVTAVPTPAALADLAAGFDAITFTSPSSVRNFVNLTSLQNLSNLAHAVIACIGPVTAAEAAKFNLRVDLIPDEYTIGGLVQVLREHFVMKGVKHKA
ncbi:MAG: uroporphyrinogen-III synthase, partial [Anaerolineales bacterium]|nr:uroporphyrinogen-III synthase [Anaerolineales bacterium]